QAGVAGDENVQKRNAEGRVGHAHFAVFLSGATRAKRKQEEYRSDSASDEIANSDRFAVVETKWVDFHRADYTQRGKNLSTLAARQRSRGAGNNNLADCCNKKKSERLAPTRTFRL